MRYHLTPVKMAIFVKTKDKKHWQGCGGKGKPCTPLVGMQNGAAAMENSMEVP